MLKTEINRGHLFYELGKEMINILKKPLKRGFNEFMIGL
jgi:hypothetical protein